MTDLRTLAIRTAGRFDMTDEAAEDTLRIYLKQVEAVDQRTIDPDNINDDDADFLIEAVAHAHSAGDLGERELFHLHEVVTEVDYARSRLAHAEAERNTAIKAALDAGARVRDVAAAAGLSRQRVEQIRGA